jgi:threonine/homoserine/homoserine lactone efflux protein
MSVDLFLALLAFAFATSVTPGPNNLMLLASGVNFGFRRSIPHMLGVGLGFGLMVIVIGLGLGAVFETYPVMHRLLAYGGGTYMLWLAWKIATTGPVVGEAKVGSRPMTFLQAALFQWVNPKAWVMAITAVATYTVASSHAASVLLVGLTFVLVNIPSISVWTLSGVAIRRVLTDPRHLRLFNIGMALLLLASLAPLLKI